PPGMRGAGRSQGAIVARVRGRYPRPTGRTAGRKLPGRYARTVAVAPSAVYEGDPGSAGKTAKRPRITRPGRHASPAALAPALPRQGPGPRVARAVRPGPGSLPLDAGRIPGIAVC